MSQKYRIENDWTADSSARIFFVRCSQKLFDWISDKKMRFYEILIGSWKIQYWICIKFRRYYAEGKVSCILNDNICRKKTNQS